jgi:protein-tyrosine-phosphatase
VNAGEPGPAGPGGPGRAGGGGPGPVGPGEAGPVAPVGPGPVDETFRILVVCSGNMCRSPLAELLLRAKLAAALGAGADRVQVTSAGTAAVPGVAMDPRAAAEGETLGVSPAGFVSRAVTAADVATADLVLGAAREHRAAAVRLYPAAHRYAFTVREFARLAEAIPLDELPDLDPVHRGRALVLAAAARRGVVRPARPEDDDVPDPHGGLRQVHREVGAVLDRAVSVAVAVLAAHPTAAPVPAGGPEVPILAAPHPASPTTRPASGGAVRGVARRVARRAGRGVVRVAGRVGRRRAVLTGPPDRPVQRRRSSRGRAARRVVLRSGLGALALLLLGTGWIVLRGMQAQRELTAARADVSGVRTALLAGDLPAARAALAAAQRRTRHARGLTGDPVWRVAAALPYVGANPDAVRTVSAAVDDLSHGALPALVRTGETLDPARLRPTGDRVSVGAFTAAAPAIATARADVVATRDRLDTLTGRPLLPTVSGAVGQLRAELTSTARALDGVGRASRLVPAMLGGRGERRYLVVFQNNAEARATGGLLGAYAIVSVRDGRMAVERIGSNTDLRSADTVPVDLGGDFRAAWGNAPALWVNGNLDANFPNAARIWLALWHRQNGQSLDGVLATDPVALGYLLRATGPVELTTGQSVSSADAARLTMHDVYARSDDNAVRDAFLRSVAGSVVSALVAGQGPPRAVLDELSRAASERRLLLYSAHPAEQKDIAPTVVSGILSGLPGPYAFVAVNNAGGNKMDYYLQRTIRYDAGPCVGGRRASRLTVTLGNSAPDPARLPVYVSQRLDDATGTRSQSTSDGSVVALVSVYGPLQGGVAAATLDGRPLAVSNGKSGARPVWTFPVVVDAGRHRTVVLDLVEPGSRSAPVVPVQPLVLPARVSVSAADCG